MPWRHATFRQTVSAYCAELFSVQSLNQGHSVASTEAGRLVEGFWQKGRK